MEWTQTSIINTLTSLMVLIGVPFTIGTLLKVGRKLQVLDSLEITTKTIKHNLHAVTTYLIRNHTTFDPSELQAMSPLKLTAKGKQFIQEVDFERIFSEHRADFYQCIDDEQPLLKYDVEQAAKKAIFVLSDKSFMSFLKVFFYNHPDRNLENVAPTLAVFVRDRYLEDHLEIRE